MSSDGWLEQEFPKEATLDVKIVHFKKAKKALGYFLKVKGAAKEFIKKPKGYDVKIINKK